jgi:hypothetical protein
VELVHRRGISKKTGRPYDFWACPEKTDGKFCEYIENPKKLASQVGLNEEHYNNLMTAIKMVNANIQGLAKMLLPKKPSGDLPPELDEEVDLSDMQF